MIRYLSLFLLNGLTASKIVYSDEISRKSLIYASISAYSENPGPCFELGFENCQLGRRITVVCDDSSENYTCSGFTAVCPEENVLLVVFGGNYTSFRNLAGKFNSWPAGGLVSDYFFNGFFRIWNNGLKDTFDKAVTDYPGYQVWVTGHSLGGALASLAASHIIYNQLHDPNQLLLVTFGQPRVGNRTFAQSVTRDVINAFRITHSHDPVPQEPEKGEFWHFGSEVFYNKKMSGWNICEDGESENCSDGQNSDWDYQDHLNYFNKSILSLAASNCQ